MGGAAVGAVCLPSAQVDEADVDSVDLQSAQAGGANAAGAMDKVKKILNSPGSRRKALQVQPAHSSQYFGVSLEDLAQREGRDISKLVTKICCYIYQHGQ